MAKKRPDTPTRLALLPSNHGKSRSLPDQGNTPPLPDTEQQVQTKRRAPDLATIALLKAWEEEARALTPEERAAAQAEGDALMAGLNQNRADEGRPPVFP